MVWTIDARKYKCRLKGMTFEFDPAKSAANRAKHGIDFDEAKELWLGKTVSASVDFPGEPRTLVIGKIAGKHWTAVVIERGDNVRLISVRRARRKEEQMYDQKS